MKVIYVIFCTVFPELLVLRLADSNNATMDKIYYHVHKAILAIDNNSDDLNNPILFLPPEEDNDKMGMTTHNLPPRSLTLMRMLYLDMTWMVLMSAVTQRATTGARVEP